MHPSGWHVWREKGEGKRKLGRTVSKRERRRWLPTFTNYPVERTPTELVEGAAP